MRTIRGGGWARVKNKHRLIIINNIHVYTRKYERRVRKKKVIVCAHVFKLVFTFRSEKQPPRRHRRRSVLMKYRVDVIDARAQT